MLQCCGEPEWVRQQQGGLQPSERCQGFAQCCALLLCVLLLLQVKIILNFGREGYMGN